MSVSYRCNRCGATAQAGAPEGFCSSCLLEFGLLGFPDDAVDGGGPAADRGGDSPQDTPLMRAFGDYELLRELGRGGMGVVYQARQISLNRIVALKMIQAGRFAGAQDIKRFRTEASAAAALRHPGLVTVFAVGEHAGQCYFTMEYVEGGSLAELIRCHPLPAHRASRCVQAIADAVHHAHLNGVLHRDLKPSNVLLDPEGRPRVTDFGLAKRLTAPESGAADGALTLTGQIVGSPNYMAPEQAAGPGVPVDARADLFSIGAILYELLTGRPPFQAATPLDTLQLVRERDPVAPRQLNPRVPRDLETICLKCLEKETSRRYASAQDLSRDLGRFLDGASIHARAAGRPEKLWRWCRRNPVIAASFTAIVLLLLVVAVGASIATVLISRQENAARQKLWTSYLEQARSGRLSGQPGSRSNSLAALAAAARMRPALALRNEAIASLALTDLGPGQLLRASSPGSRFEFSLLAPDGERYAVLHEAGRVTVHRTADHQFLADLPAPRHRGAFARFSPDGRFLAGNFGGGRVALWDLQASPPIARTNFPVSVPGHPTFAFTPDSQTLILADADGTLHSFAPATGNHLAATPTGLHPGWIELSPDGDRVALIEHAVHVWSRSRQELIRTLSHRVAAESMAWHPDGRRLAAGYGNGELLLWDTQSGEPQALPGHTQFVWNVAFDPAGELLASLSFDGAAHLWHGVTGRPLLTTVQSQIRQFTRDGRNAGLLLERGSLGRAPVIRSRSFRTLSIPSLHQRFLNSIDVSPDQRWLAVGAIGAWHLWDLQANAEAAHVPCPPTARAWFHPDGRSVLTISPDVVQRWPIESAATPPGVRVGPPQTLLRYHDGRLGDLHLSADGRRLASAGRQCVLLDLDQPDRTVTFSRERGQNTVSLSADQRWIAAADYLGVGVTLWSAQTGDAVRHLITNENARVAFSPVDPILVTVTVRECVFWDTGTWQPRRRLALNLPGEVPGPLAFSRDGRLLALAADRRHITLLNPATAEEWATLTAPAPENFENLSIGSDGSWVAAATMNWVIELWDLRTLRSELAVLGLDW